MSLAPTLGHARGRGKRLTPILGRQRIVRPAEEGKTERLAWAFVLPDAKCPAQVLAACWQGPRPDGFVRPAARPNGRGVGAPNGGAHGCCDTGSRLANRLDTWSLRLGEAGLSSADLVATGSRAVS